MKTVKNKKKLKLTKPSILQIMRIQLIIQQYKEGKEKTINLNYGFSFQLF